ncbi:hypothetical protein GGR51DRAFT_524616 [Nemania sp. FL0031]|nr:hypothetical protein GGR51DRAFT_524616 [Nemania sp. FL0031]
MEKPQRDVKSHGLKTLKDSRWANTEEPKKNTRHYKNKVETSYNGPRLIMDMEEFQHDVKKYGLKTLKDSRWAS